MHNTPSHYKYRPGSQLITLLGLVLIGASLGQHIGLRITSIEAASLHTLLPPKEKLLILQATSSIGAFILAPMLYLRILAPASMHPLFERRRETYTRLLLLMLAVVPSWILLIGWLPEWHTSLKLPAWLSHLEQWARAQEQVTQYLTQHITTIHTPQDLISTILVISVIPAIGEELLFRGIIQPLLYRSTKNIHLAIIITSILFSAIHLQFYGFFFRFALSILLGYIYVWTRDLSLPMAAHFLNNTIAIAPSFLAQHYFPEATGNELVAYKPIILPIACLIAIWSTYKFYKISAQQRQTWPK